MKIKYANKKVKLENFSNLNDLSKDILSSFLKRKAINFKKVNNMKKDVLIEYHIRTIRDLEKEYNKSVSLVFYNEKDYEIAKEIYRLLNPHKLKIGLSLAGGGARGAYQVGVLSVLEKEGLLDNISMIVGTSIGAFTMLFYKESGIEKSKKLWCELDPNVVLTKNNLAQVIKTGARYSRKETIDFLNRIVKNEEIGKDSTKLYVQSFSYSSLKLKHTKINNLSKEKIIKNLIATSSLPIIFGLSNVNGEVHGDAGFIDNDGIEFLKSQGCNVIICVPLQRELVSASKKKRGLSILDFGSCHYYPGRIKGLVDFYPERSKYKIEYGEKIATLMVEKLKKEGVYDILKNNKGEDFYKLNQLYRLDKNENTIKFKY